MDLSKCYSVMICQQTPMWTFTNLIKFCQTQINKKDSLYTNTDRKYRHINLLDRWTITYENFILHSLPIIICWKRCKDNISKMNKILISIKQQLTSGNKLTGFSIGFNSVKNILSCLFLSKLSWPGFSGSITNEMFKMYTQITCFLQSVETLRKKQLLLFADRYKIVSGHLCTWWFLGKQRVRISLIFLNNFFEGEEHGSEYR